MSSDKLRAAACRTLAAACAAGGFLFLPEILLRLSVRAGGGLLVRYCANAAQQVFIFLVPSLLILAARSGRWRRFRSTLRPVAFSTFSCAFLLAAGGAVMVSLIASLWSALLEAATGYAGASQPLPVPADPREWAVALAAVAVVPAICEELFFRAVIQRALCRFFPRAGVWMAALVFAVLHFRWEAFPALLLVGAALGLIFVRYGLRACALTHALYNGAALILYVGAESVSLPMLAACCAACASALWLLLGKEQADETDRSGL